MDEQFILDLKGKITRIFKQQASSSPESVEKLWNFHQEYMSSYNDVETLVSLEEFSAMCKKRMFKEAFKEFGFNCPHGMIKCDVHKKDCKQCLMSFESERLLRHEDDHHIVTAMACPKKRTEYAYAKPASASNLLIYYNQCKKANHQNVFIKLLNTPGYQSCYADLCNNVIPGSFYTNLVNLGRIVLKPNSECKCVSFEFQHFKHRYRLKSGKKLFTISSNPRFGDISDEAFYFEPIWKEEMMQVSDMMNEPIDDYCAAISVDPEFKISQVDINNAPWKPNGICSLKLFCFQSILTMSKESRKKILSLFPNRLFHEISNLYPTMI